MSGSTVGRVPYRIVFLHPDLGLGGAERLVVDAALVLQERGYETCIVTSHHSIHHCFEETRNGTLKVSVYGDWLPRHTFGRLHVLWAVVRSIYVALRMLLNPIIAGDAVIIDQVSAPIPLLRCLRIPVVFYCHFPDLLLAKRSNPILRLYRMPFDILEQVTTGMADCILVNSRFTAAVFQQTFRWLSVQPAVLYPSINFSKYDSKQAWSLDEVGLPSRDFDKNETIVILSINRFERKKNIELAIHGFVKMRRLIEPALFNRCKLVLAGGYDLRVNENVEYDLELREVAKQHEMNISDFPDMAGDVVFMHSFNENQRSFLLDCCRFVVYTPSGEHFGIVPLESMYCRRPVVAVNDGGPTESIENDRTGLLCNPEPCAFGSAMASLVSDADLCRAMGNRGRERVLDLFSLHSFGKHLDQAVSDMLVRSKKPRRHLCESRAFIAGVICILFATLALRFI